MLYVGAKRRFSICLKTFQKLQKIGSMWPCREKNIICDLDLQKGGRKEKYFLLFLLHPRKVQADL
jgi:hypothetical protein